MFYTATILCLAWKTSQSFAFPLDGLDVPALSSDSSTAGSAYRYDEVPEPVAVGAPPLFFPEAILFSSSSASSPVSNPLPTPESVDTTTGPEIITVTETVTDPSSTVTVTVPPSSSVSPTPTNPSTPISTWASPPNFSDLACFNVTHFASGKKNLEIVTGIPSPASAGPAPTPDALTTPQNTWDNNTSVLQLFYPAGSINPSNSPQGGSEFYGAPLDLGTVRNVTLDYSVFFPADFDWVKGGKLPGLYGGHMTCSGGDAALDCFSTRLMWRADGAGELYLYAPKDKQTNELCSLPPESVCDSTYGLSIARGSFNFKLGGWTHVSQTVFLNTPGVQDGGFYLEVDNELVINRADVYYRGVPAPPDTSPTPSTDPEASAPTSTPPPSDGPLVPLVGGILGSAGDLAVAPLAAYSQPQPSPPPAMQAPPLLAEGVATVTTVTATCSAPQETVTQTVVVQQYPLAALGLDVPMNVESEQDSDPIGFSGIFFSTFFGGHEKDFATPKDQWVWFRDFSLSINDQDF
ncbi:hypothetical protein BV25DRAFT_1991733 [Artomyces pyxidatus]|uniref:Uncharacterized protein n=1 Tax=Artomyces pyxidatus TaxID=48021 RepID=A0ACB8T1P8_9AGAM|nr:hypothetical protein BV25DRAFT_1991733 [Artomyces pyxidatus]